MSDLPETQPTSGRATSARRAAGLLLLAGLLFWFWAQATLLRRGLHGLDPGARYVINHLLQLVEVLLFGWGVSKLEGRTLADYGLPWRSALRSRFWQGAAIGILALGVLVLAMVGTGALRLALPAQGGLEAPLMAAGYFLLFLTLGLREEFLYRGYALYALAGAIGFWPAAAATSAWFVTGHMGNPGETAIGLASVGLFGVIACILLRRTGDLWMPIGFHAAWDWGQTYLFGVSDSGHAAPPGHLFTATVASGAPAWLTGASTGPEGSALCLALYVGLVIAATRWRPRDRSRSVAEPSPPSLLKELDRVP